MLGDTKQTQNQSLGGNNNGSIVQVTGNDNTIIISPEDIDSFEKENILFSTIEYILKENNFTFDFAEDINPPTKLENKIKVNSINTALRELLVSGRAKRYLIDELFETNQEFSIETLRKDILKIYNRHYDSLNDMNKIIQKVYTDLYDKFNKRNADLSISIFIIISYFFEICDIGDNPNDITK